ncbi:hypothetical protein AAC387_Pa01g0247 [Persea americana]
MDRTEESSIRRRIESERDGEIRVSVVTSSGNEDGRVLRVKSEVPAFSSLCFRRADAKRNRQNGRELGFLSTVIPDGQRRSAKESF